jgi:Ion channel
LPGRVYFSMVIHTTLGLGDLVPPGSIRLLVGAQALVGCTLPPWSAPFTFLAMARYGREGSDGRHRVACGADRGRAAGD